jgi:ribosomal protein S2
VLLLAIDFSFYKKKKKEKEKKKKKKKKRKRKEGIKELKQKPHAIIVTWSYLSSMTKFF